MKGENFREGLTTKRESNTTEKGINQGGDVNFKDLFLNEEYDSYFVEFTGDIQERLKNIDYAKMYYTEKFFGVLFVKQGMLNTLLQSVPEIIIVHKNFPYTLTPTALEEDTLNSYKVEKGDVPYNGTGVVVGILGTGIDYLNPRFMNEDGTTRIISIWDQTINDEKSYPNVIFGTEFTKADIDEAIRLNASGQNPYEKVSHKDEIGYGTAMAGIIGGRKLNPNEEFSSVVPNCDFAIVKLKKAKKNVLAVNAIEETEVGVYEGTDLAEAMDYLSDLQRTLNRPMVVYIPLGSNLGGALWKHSP